MNPLQPQNGGGGFDAFVVKIAPEGGAMIYGTYLGGNEWDRGYSIAVDTAGAAHVTGADLVGQFPHDESVATGAPWVMDAFVSKLSPNGAALVYSTYLGGSRDDGVDYGYCLSSLEIIQSSMAIAVDLTGATYVIGQTKSSDFPTTTSLQERWGGGALSN
jgi:hypothetical protein